jgi:Tol biopolymer transport system component
MPSLNRRLDSWKEIGDYLGRGLSTVRRWEEEKGLPVHRVPGGARQAVFAFTDEVDQWLLQADEETVIGSPSHQNSKVLRLATRVSALPAADVAPDPQHHGRVPLAVKPRAHPTRTVILLLGAALAVLYGWLARPLRPPRITSTLRITTDGRPKGYPLVTDGSRLFFNSTAIVSEVSQVPVAGGESVTLPLPLKNVRVEDVSSDHTELLLCRYVNARAPCEVWVAPLLGGAPRRLGDLVADSDAVTWSPDRTLVAYAKHWELRLARGDGTDIRKLATLPGEPSSLRWSPDGRTLRFSVYVAEPVGLSIWEAKVDGDGAYPLLPGWSKPFFIFAGNWTPDGRYFVFQACPKHVLNTNIWALREKPGLFHQHDRGPYQLTNGPLAMVWPVVSIDGKRLFVGVYKTPYEFLRYDLQSAGLIPEFSGLPANELTFSEDGKWIAFVAEDGSLWRSASDGSQRLQLTSPPIQANLPQWSRDGKWITFFGSRDGKTNTSMVYRGTKGTRIYVVSFDGAIQRVTTREDLKTNDMNPSFSPDGSLVAFDECTWNVNCSDESRSVDEPIHVANLKTGRVSALPGSEGMWTPRWSPNGRFIAGLSSPGAKLTLYDCQTRTQSKVSDAHASWPSWPWDGKFLFYETSGDSASWWRLRMRDRKTERIADLKGLQVTEWFAPAPNNSLITKHSIGAEEIYALDFDAP